MLVNAGLLLMEATLQDQTDMQTYRAENPNLLAITNGPSLIPCAMSAMSQEEGGLDTLLM